LNILASSVPAAYSVTRERDPAKRFWPPVVVLRPMSPAFKHYAQCRPSTIRRNRRKGDDAEKRTTSPGTGMQCRAADAHLAADERVNSRFFLGSSSGLKAAQNDRE